MMGRSFLVGLAYCLVTSTVWAQQADNRTIIGAGNEFLSAGSFAIRMGQYEEGIRLTNLGLTRYQPDRTDRASALSNLCAAHAANGEPDIAIPYCDESVSMNDRNWRAYNNHYWPHKYLIDIDGFIVYDHIGEGSYEETEEKIVELLNERSLVLGERKVALDMVVPQDAEQVNFSEIKTPETYLGHDRLNSLANSPSADCFNKECYFELPGDIALNAHALGGYWEIGNEEISLKRGKGSILIRFSANKVNLVASSQNGGAKAQIFLDGKLIEEMNAGRHIVDGIVNFNEPDLYNLVDLRGNYGEHVLEIRFSSGEFSAFAFTFG